MSATAFSFARVHRACSCGAFGSEVRTPCGVDLCWICAHAVGAHAATASDPAAIAAAVSHCACAAEAVYPPDVLRRRGLLRDHADRVASTRRGSVSTARP